MNAVVGIEVKLEQVSVTGIRGITPQMINEAAQKQLVYKLVAIAEITDGQAELCVAPILVPQVSFLGGITGWEMGVEFVTDLFETMKLKIDETSVFPTSAAVLRDIVHYTQGAQRNSQLQDSSAETQRVAPDHLPWQFDFEVSSRLRRFAAI